MSWRIFVVGVSLWCGLSASAADCPQGGVYLFPRPGSVVPTNARFLLEGVGTDQARVQSLVGKKVTFVSASGEDRVTAGVEKGWISSHGRVAVLLKPQTPLAPETPYTLLLDEVLGGAVVLNAASSSKAARWRSGKGPDLSAPRWVKKPAVSYGEYVVEGSSLRRFITFGLELAEESPSYLVVSLRRAAGSSAVQTYFVPVKGTEARVGHDGCSGGFVYEDGRAYRARIDGFDLAGNAAPKIPIIEFQAPRQEAR